MSVDLQISSRMEGDSWCEDKLSKKYRPNSLALKDRPARLSSRHDSISSADSSSTDAGYQSSESSQSIGCDQFKVREDDTLSESSISSENSSGNSANDNAAASPSSNDNSQQRSVSKSTKDEEITLSKNQIIYEPDTISEVIIRVVTSNEYSLLLDDVANAHEAATDDGIESHTSGDKEAVAAEQINTDEKCDTKTSFIDNLLDTYKVCIYHDPMPCDHCCYSCIEDCCFKCMSGKHKGHTVEAAKTCHQIIKCHNFMTKHTVILIRSLELKMNNAAFFYNSQTEMQDEFIQTSSLYACTEKINRPSVNSLIRKMIELTETIRRDSNLYNKMMKGILEWKEKKDINTIQNQMKHVRYALYRLKRHFYDIPGCIVDSELRVIRACNVEVLTKTPLTHWLKSANLSCESSQRSNLIAASSSYGDSGEYSRYGAAGASYYANNLPNGRSSHSFDSPLATPSPTVSDGFNYAQHGPITPRTPTAPTAPTATPNSFYGGTATAGSAGCEPPRFDSPFGSTFNASRGEYVAQPPSPMWPSAAPSPQQSTAESGWHHGLAFASAAYSPSWPAVHTPSPFARCDASQSIVPLVKNRRPKESTALPPPLVPPPPYGKAFSPPSPAAPSFEVSFHTERDYSRIRQPVAVFGGEGDAAGKLCRPWGVCVDPEGNVVVVDRSNNRIQIFRSDGSFVRSFGSRGTEPGQFERPAGVAIDNRGRLVIADKDNHRVQVMSVEGVYQYQFGHHGARPGEFHYPWDVACSANGNIAVTDSRNHRIQLFDQKGRFLKKFGYETRASMHHICDLPRGIAFASPNVLYCTDFNNHKVLEVDFAPPNPRCLNSDKFRKNAKCATRNTDRSHKITVNLQRPQGLTVDANGNALICDSRNYRIQVFSKNGAFVGEFGIQGKEPGQFDRPSGVAVAPDGKIVVVDFGNNRIQVF